MVRAQAALICIAAEARRAMEPRTHVTASRRRIDRTTFRKIVLYFQLERQKKYIGFVSEVGPTTLCMLPP